MERPSLCEVVDLGRQIDVVDIGANPIDGDAPYKSLLDAGLARIFGFEPNLEALARLNRLKGPHETYVASAVYDGSVQELKVCKAQGMTSLLEPNTDLLGYLHGFAEWAKVDERVAMPTVRLDDVAEIETMDYLKIDIQGAELQVFKNATDRLRDCLVVHTEVEFLPMYRDQPLFSEVELFLREQGFVFHRFAPLVSRILQPMLVDNDVYGQMSQATYADAVFVRDFTRFDELESEQLKIIALILNDIYHSLDLALRALMAHDRNFQTTYVKEYGDYLSSAKHGQCT